ncbi:hypothetical protein EDI_146400 [Entamoeba dispar SAW760]|uniref:ABC transmembrane type-1 domain-containing protein n=1 Tax=Entamoeba dispar (strain ATCC PRA-260 / SAW760) TaxID=370354 RepID=B0ETR8_ENTDS|nr:uncharacterized protein EDI_146400 [Entamoeba dispar SAW760]EDR22078.1 hypothetical protein EDI_146400 [Entamoeba dispar SAW760]|eukprot:EDR22078.1 hypothetical protein EDI_146400 [Entamoeba dispar SAW760]
MCEDIFIDYIKNLQDGNGPKFGMIFQIFSIAITGYIPEFIKSCDLTLVLIVAVPLSYFFQRFQMKMNILIKSKDNYVLFFVHTHLEFCIYKYQLIKYLQQLVEYRYDCQSTVGECFNRCNVNIKFKDVQFLGHQNIGNQLVFN